MANVVEIVIKAIDQTSDAFIEATKNIEKLSLSSAAVQISAAIGFTAAGTALAALTEKSIENAENMLKLSRAAAAPIEEFSKLSYAAKITGGSADEMVKVYKNLNKSITDAVSDAGSKQAQVFQALGIHLTDASGKVKSQNEIMLELADSFSHMEEGADKGTLAQIIFAKSFQDALPFLDHGRDKLEELENQTKRTSLAFAEQAEQYTENMRAMQAGVGAIGKTIATYVIPYFVQFTDWVLKMQKESGVFVGVGLTVVDLLKGMAIEVYTVWSVIKALFEIVGAGAYIFEQFAIGVITNVVMQFKIMGDTIMAIVHGFIALGETAGRIGEIIYKFFSGDFSGAWESSKSTINEMRAEIVKVGTDIADSWGKNQKTAQDALENSYQNIKAASHSLVNTLKADLADYTKTVDSIVVGPKTSAKEEKKTAAPVLFDAEAYAAEMEKELAAYEAWVKKREAALGQLESMEDKYRESSVDGAEKMLAEFDRAYNSEARKSEKFFEDDLISADEMYLAQYDAYLNMQDKITAALKNHSLQRAELQASESRADINDYIKKSQMTMGQFLMEKGMFEQLSKLSVREKNMSLAQAQAEYNGRKALIAEYQAVSERSYFNIYSFAGNMAKTFQAGLSNALTGLLEGTMTLSQAFKALGESMLKGVIDYVAQWISSKITMIAMEAIFGAATVATNVATAAALASAWAPAAAFASIASFGGADVAGSAGLIATMSVAKGLAIVGQAHSGLDYVPREGTYLLKEGEGVLKKEENAARMQGKGQYDNGAVGDVYIDGEKLGRVLFKMIKSGRLNLAT